jgi:hypothetical protein
MGKSQRQFVKHVRHLLCAFFAPSLRLLCAAAPQDFATVMFKKKRFNMIRTYEKEVL